MKSVTRHAALAALASLVALTVHQLAYLAAFPVTAARAEQLADHGHLATQWALVTPLAVLSAAGFVVVQVRRLGFASNLRWQPLGALAAALFVGQEAVEAALRGSAITSVLEHPAVLVGLAIAPIVAALVVRAIHEAVDFVARLRQPEPSDFLTSPSALGWSDAPLPRLFWLESNSPRGPPWPIRN